MTPISVGSSGSTGGTNAIQGASGNDGAPASGFGELLAGAHSPHDPHAPSAREAQHERDNDPCNQTDAHAAATDADDTDTDTTDATDAATTDDPPAKPDGAADPTGMIAALALTTPIADPTKVPPTDATAATGGNASTPVTDVTTPVVDLAAGDEAAPATPPSQVVDLAEVLASLPASDAPPSADPVLLPLPDLPSAGATAAKTAPPTTAATHTAREQFAPSAATERPHAPTAPPPTGAATFAPLAPPPPATAAMASVAAEDGTAARVTPPPSEQLVSVLTPLRTNQNGAYTLRLELKPPELGRVEMRVEMRDGVLHASIHAEHHDAAQTLRNALSDLRDKLGAEGVRTGDLSVSDGGVGARQDANGRAAETRATGPDLRATDDIELATDIPAPAPGATPDTTSLLDVRV